MVFSVPAHAKANQATPRKTCAAAGAALAQHPRRGRRVARTGRCPVGGGHSWLSLCHAPKRRCRLVLVREVDYRKHHRLNIAGSDVSRLSILLSSLAVHHFTGAGAWPTPDNFLLGTIGPSKKGPGLSCFQLGRDTPELLAAVTFLHWKWIPWERTLACGSSPYLSSFFAASPHGNTR